MAKIWSWRQKVRAWPTFPASPRRGEEGTGWSLSEETAGLISAKTTMTSQTLCYQKTLLCNSCSATHAGEAAEEVPRTDRPPHPLRRLGGETGRGSDLISQEGREKGGESWIRVLPLLYFILSLSDPGLYYECHRGGVTATPHQPPPPPPNTHTRTSKPGVKCVTILFTNNAATFYKVYVSDKIEATVTQRHDFRRIEVISDSERGRHRSLPRLRAFPPARSRAPSSAIACTLLLQVMWGAKVWAKGAPSAWL